MSLDESTAALNLRRRYIEGLLFRAIPAAAFAIFLPLAAEAGMMSWRPVVPVVALLLVNCLLNVPYWYAGRYCGFPLSHFYVHWGIDLGVLTAIVYALGGIDIPLVQFAYLVMILVAALFVSQRTAFILATGASFAYALLGATEILPPPP